MKHALEQMRLRQMFYSHTITKESQMPDIRLISEESWDTDDWSNDAESSALITGINYILQYIHRTVIFKL